MSTNPKRSYPLLTISGGKKSAHRASFEFFKGPIPSGMCVCHRCDNRFCVNPDHLFLGTSKDNSQDMVRKGRAPCQKGEANFFAKLTEEAVLDIRTKRLRQCDYARKYGLAHSHVNRITNGQAWSHLQGGGDVPRN